jgi:alkanesulfonate monooxygenase SsuD/methylene tetrahydromethanopterin reductase-like flavin-dependent oxidoreductase (luciferase family)
VNVGVGLPTTTPAADRELLLDWARRAEDGPFPTLAVLDRVAYDSYEPFTALAAAAATTERIRLATMIAVGPLRTGGMLAKLAGSVAALCGNRLTLGLAVGARLDDFEAAGVETRGRGRRLSEQLAFLRSDWEESPIGPAAADRNGLELLVGGASGPAFSRMARYADGYAHGGGPPRAFARAAATARAAWSDMGRPGEPRLWGQGYFALGEEERGADYLRDYYAFTGPFAEKIAAANLTSARAIKDFIRGYEDEGCDELILLPTVSDIGQLDRLAEVLASR